MHLKNVVHLVHNPCAKSFKIARLTYSIHFGTDYDNCSVEINYDSISLPCERKTPAKPLDLDIKAVTGPSIFSPVQWKKYWKRNRIDVLLILTGICLLLSVIFLLSSTSTFLELRSLNLSSTKEVCDASPRPFNFKELETSVMTKLKSLEQQFDEKRKVSLQKMEEQLLRIERKLGTLQNCRDISSWRKFQTNAYYFFDTEENWEMAKKKCADCNSRLVIINTKQEQDFLIQTLKQSMWLGLSDIEKEGAWRWIDGSPLRQGSWRTGEPNNGGRNGEDCAVLYKEGKWNDIHCAERVRFVCEMEQVSVQ
ncbi:low affinity immunoglobulin epsilon Fc receptor-like [Thamnophis elegans]|uniref:low affinity immunoglobulin epsilon Fc receptor-like n=1 Tax=Thamnophis elegans TaxID=35005 RepID=UPI00137885CA|nr:low affinity immunoglobulin epsilon Fc receptor-like [Thamnophis elegans]